jgi:DNA-binding CsgD family transcriptional regulator
MTMLHLLLLDQIGSGRWAAAEDSARLGAELTATHHNELFRLQFVAYDGLRAASAGDVETARRCAAEVTGWAGPRRIGSMLGFVRRIAVLVALAEADYEAAYAAALRIGAAGDFAPYAHHAVDGIFDLVEAAVHAGHLDEARAHTDAAVRLRFAENSPRLDALITAARAMTTTDDEAGTLYQSALAHAALAEFPFEHNRIRLAYGMWLRRQRRHTAARDALQLASEAFDSLGASPWADRARTELRAAGAGVKRSGGDTVRLSAQEHRIAELAAAGHSNKQIAAQLYLSPRTVGAHLYRIFPKLGVTSRAGLGQAMRELADP